MYISNIDLSAILSSCNLILSSAIVITAFSLLIYILAHNLGSEVARAFCALLAFVIVVYVGDVVLLLLYGGGSPSAVAFWLKFQWIGIALVPAAYLHFSDALLRTTNAFAVWRRLSILVSYLISLILLCLAIFTDSVVKDGVYTPQTAHLKAAPLFWVFAVYFFVTVVWGFVNIRHARQRCLTSTSRRRMTYLALSFAAPALGVFPYLVVASMPGPLSSVVLNLFLLAGNVGVAFMIVVMAYSVAYFGALTPDRVIKHSLIHYLLRGPFVAICVVGLMLIVPRVEYILGLPRDTVLVFTVVGTILLLQLFVNVAKPFIDRLIYRQDRGEITWIQTLDRRLLTTTDLRQILENVLVALCELLRVRSGFVAVLAGGRPCLEAFCGSPHDPQHCLAHWDLPALVKALADKNKHPEKAARTDYYGDGNGSKTAVLGNEDFVVQDGYWLLPLRTKSREATLGILGVEARASLLDLTPTERESVGALVSQAELALEDRHLQQGVFTALKDIIPDIERVQRWRSTTVHYSGSQDLLLEKLDDHPLYAPDFARWVKDALSHYWGGPKLTDSPLLRLKVVEEALRENGGNPAKALRVVLGRAIEGLKPEGQRSMTAAEWILYNILELKFIQGRSVRDIAIRLAMSESDLYRKQRVAIEEVAKTLAEMEQANDGKEEVSLSSEPTS